MTGSVAVIGAGPGGLAAARWLLSQGFEPTTFEQAPMLGGQWTGLVGLSGVWPTMHTNTSRVLTAFSDLEHETDLVYPSGRDILAYLGRYAESFGLMSRIRSALGSSSSVDPTPNGWCITQAPPRASKES
jgi:dimethylaniline monooxygenase (N-oxide forming)